MGTWMSLIDECAEAVRSLRRAPFTTFLTSAVLALGIGATTLVFHVVDSVLLRSSADSATTLTRLERRATRNRFSFAEYELLKQRLPIDARVAAYSYFRTIAAGDGEPTVIMVEAVTSSYWQLLGLAPVVGEVFRGSDGSGGVPVVVISYSLWQRQFGGSADVLSRDLYIAGRRHKIVGVLPKSFRGLYLPALLPTDAWVPPDSARSYSRNSVADLRSADDRVFLVVAGVPADRDVSTWSHAVTAASEPLRPNLVRASSRPYISQQVDAIVLPVAVGTMVAGGLVLLLAATNVAAVASARVTTRVAEFATRVALGASPGRIVRVILLESACVACLGAVLAVIGVVAITSAVPWIVPPPTDIGLRFADIPIFSSGGAVAAGAALLVTAVLAGAMPARFILRLNVAASLTGHSARSGLWRRHSARAAGLFCQCAVSVALVVLTVSLVDEVLKTRVSRLPVDAQNLIVGGVELSLFDELPQGRTRFFEELVTKSVSLPGVAGAAMASDLPLERTIISPGERVLRVVGADGEQRSVRVIGVSPDYFDVMGLSLRAGRGFTRGESVGTSMATVLSESAWRQFGGKSIAGGLQVEGLGAIAELSVIGVVADASGGDDQPGTGKRAAVYVPFEVLDVHDAYLVVRTRSAPTAVLSSLRSAVREIAPHVAFTEVGPMRPYMVASSYFANAVTLLLAVLAGLSVCLASAGVFATINFMVAQRRRECALRIALGSTRAGVYWHIARNTALVVGAGTTAGVLAGIAGARAMGSVVVGSGSVEPWLVGAGVGAVLGASIVAAWTALGGLVSANPGRALRGV